MLNPIKTKLTVLIAGLACLGIGVLFASTLEWTPTTLATQTASAPTTQASLRETGNAFTQIAQTVTPAVVSIRGQQRVDRREIMPDFGPFDRFFEHPPLDQDGGNGESPQEDLYRQSGGSGVVIRPDGYILTNNHVVDGMAEIQVILNDRRAFDAEVVGSDPSTDIAVIKIDADDLPAARLASDEQVNVGEWVLALGNPFGLDFTMTAGIVSAIGRGDLRIIDRGDNPYAIENFIQTDAAINPGNSGGPLVNIDGQVIGINTAIASRTGGYQGYGFAIPISIARRVAEQLIDTGEVRRAVLGVQIQPVTPLDQEALALPTIAGVRIDGFTDLPGQQNPAREAGLRLQDVVLEVAGKSVSTPSELQEAIAFHQPGDVVELTVWRDHDRRNVKVKLGERPASPAEPVLASQDEAPGGDGTVHESSLGMDVQDLTPRMRRTIVERMNVTADRIPAGVYIRDIESLGAADDAGIGEGGIITQVGDVVVHNVEEYRNAVAALEPGQVVYLRIYYPQGDNQLFRALRVPR
ncbi:MAG TPA: trypsin-like peptidase domain-containing protein [Gemmatimonadota bacterium]|jgi:serine protease Do